MKTLKNLYLLLSAQGINYFDIYLDKDHAEVFVETQNEENEYENLDDINKIIDKHLLGNNKKLTTNTIIKMAELICTILSIISIESVIYYIHIDMVNEIMTIHFDDEKIFPIKFRDCEEMKIINVIINNYY